MIKTPHRFFRAMVLMSSGVALGCGGISGDGSDEPSPSGGGGGASGAGGGPGGAPTISLGGGGADGGSAGALSLGGTAGAGVVDPGPFPCDPAQWDCSELDDKYCGYGPTAWGWQLPEGCACDEERPSSAADCGSAESFVCRNATTFHDGRALSEAIPFECSCVPTQDYCQESCQQAFPDLYDASCEQSSNTILCGCAVVVLR